MSRKTVPLLTIAITLLLVVLVVVIVLQLTSPERRWAGESRNDAVRILLSTNPGRLEADQYNLSRIAVTAGRTLVPGGTLSNLNHFLSKDPGRTDFARPVDRQRARRYLNEEVLAQAEKYSSEYQTPGAPEWAPLYSGTVKSLFDAVRTDVLQIWVVPQEITWLKVPEPDKRSYRDLVELAVADFARDWIPPGETLASYKPERSVIRDYLLKSRKFPDRMEELNSHWNNLAAALYNLSVNPRWLTAVQYRPELNAELDELIVLIHTAEIFFREKDIMGLVPDISREPGAPISPGILWLPEYSFYKNIPEITGNTSDEVPTFFFAKVNLGYTFRDLNTQTWLNRRKDWLTDYFNTFFSSKTTQDFSPINSGDTRLFAWSTARLKAEAIHGINRNIVSDIPMGVKGAFGVRNLTFVRVNLLVSP